MRSWVLGVCLLLVVTVPPGSARGQEGEAAKTAAAAGIYVVTAAGPQPMPMEMPSGNDMRGGLRPSMTFSFAGLTADLRLGTQPEFRFVIPRMKHTTDPAEMMRAAAMMNARPNQFTIVRLSTDRFDRILDTRKGKKIEIEVERLTTETYRAKPKSALEPGEYALCATYGSAMMGQAWMFGVDR